MAINSILRLDNEEKGFNVLKFEYKLERETKKKVEKNKASAKFNNLFDQYVADMETAAEKKRYAEFEERYNPAKGSEGPSVMTYNEYSKNKQKEEVEEEQYYPQSSPKGGIITFDILAQPNEVTLFHKWLLNLTDRKSGSFTFTLSIGGKKMLRTIAFSQAYCVKIKESFESQTKDQMLFKISICALCIRFGKDLEFVHEKLPSVLEKEAQKKEAEKQAKKAEEDQKKLELTSNV